MEERNTFFAPTEKSGSNDKSHQGSQSGTARTGGSGSSNNPTGKNQYSDGDSKSMGREGSSDSGKSSDTSRSGNSGNSSSRSGGNSDSNSGGRR